MENGALVKHSIDDGSEKFITEVNFTMQKKMESLANFYLSDALFGFFFRNDYNFSGIVVDGDMAYLASARVSAVDLSSGREAWNVKADILTGEKAMRMAQASQQSGYSGKKLGGALLGAATFVGDIDPTPLIVGKYLIYRSVEGKYTCVDKQSGKEIWSEKIGWSGDIASDGKDTMFVSLGNKGYDGNGKPKVNGRPGFAAYTVSDGSELWSHKFKDPIIGIIDNAEGNGALLFSGMNIYDINFQSGELTEKLDLKKDWGLNMYLLGRDKKGNAGAMPAVSITGYKIK